MGPCFKFAIVLFNVEGVRLVLVGPHKIAEELGVLLLDRVDVNS